MSIIGPHHLSKYTLINYWYYLTQHVLRYMWSYQMQNLVVCIVVVIFNFRLFDQRPWQSILLFTWFCNLLVKRNITQNATFISKSKLVCMFFLRIARHPVCYYSSAWQSAGLSPVEYVYFCICSTFLVYFK